MLGRVFRTKIPSHTIDMYVRRMNIFASGHNHHQSLWYYLQPFIWSLRLAQIYFGESSPPALTTFKEDSCTRRSKWKHNFSNLTWWLEGGCFLKGIKYFDMRRVMLRIWCFERILTMFWTITGRSIQNCRNEKLSLNQNGNFVKHCSFWCRFSNLILSNR